MKSKMSLSVASPEPDIAGSMAYASLRCLGEFEREKIPGRDAGLTFRGVRGKSPTRLQGEPLSSRWFEQ